MDYSNAKYRLAMFYTSLNLLDLKKSPELWTKSINKHVNQIKNINLIQRGLLYRGRLNVTAIRKSKYDQNKGLIAIISKLKGDETEFGYYIHDKDFSPTNAPLFFINIHVSGCGEIAGRSLTSSKGSLLIGAFFLVAITKTNIDNSTFKANAKSTFELLNGVCGFTLNDVDYKYDGFTPIEWAYKNHSAKLTSGNLDEWKPLGGVAI